ncbi:hypothetical protein EON78_03695, partial [bacterium]
MSHTKTDFMKLFVLAFSILYCFTAAAQDTGTLSRRADSSYQAKSYPLAADLYVQSAAAAEFKPQLANNYYNAACSFALAGDKVQALKYLQLAIDNGYS